MKKIDLIGKVEGISLNNEMVIISVNLNNNNQITIRASKDYEDSFGRNKIYWFEVQEIYNELRDKKQFSLVKYETIYNFFDNDLQNLENILGYFYEYAPIKKDEIEKQIDNYLKKIKNNIYFNITNSLYSKYKTKFLIYPAAIKFHHNYFGGLSFHTLSMLKLADKIMEVYDFLDKELVYSGIILHDLMKVKEFDDPIVSEYTVEGQLIGHINLITQEVELEAFKLGYSGLEEVVLLQHVLLAHHGVPNYGSPKKPSTPEALLVHFVDNIDSKFSVLEKEFSNTKNGKFTEPVGVLDKLKFYKSHNSKKGD